LSLANYLKDHSHLFVQLINSYLETTKKNVRNGNSLRSNGNGNHSVNLSTSMDFSTIRDELPDLSHTLSKSMNTGTMGPPQVYLTPLTKTNLLENTFYLGQTFTFQSQFTSC
jgi:hypothetical protein